MAMNPMNREIALIKINKFGLLPYSRQSGRNPNLLPRTSYLESFAPTERLQDPDELAKWRTTLLLALVSLSLLSGGWAQNTTAPHIAAKPLASFAVLILGNPVRGFLKAGSRPGVDVLQEASARDPGELVVRNAGRFLPAFSASI